jgi:DNA primase
MVDNVFIDELLQKVDIVEVIGSYIPLKKAGANFKALCPFHNEKTPSFIVGPKKQIFRCFGCGAGGNVINFVMKYERLNFRETLEMLAKKAGMQLPETKKMSREDSSVIANLRKVHVAAASWYHKTLQSLPKDSPVPGYLAKRHLREQTLRDFKIGYAPLRSDEFIRAMTTQGLSKEDLAGSGLCAHDDHGMLYARFRDRIMFPIFDGKSTIIAFGGRALQGDTTAKYINSPETKIYSKGSHLYGLNFSADEIRKKDCAIIVEGYMDCIIPFQEGLKNIVASLGTSLTTRQIRQLKRHTKNVAMLYDADEAGELAMLRGFDLLLEEDMNVRVVALPRGFDPDNFVVRHGVKALEELVSRAQNLFDYKLKVLCAQYDVKNIAEKVKVVEEMLPTLKKVRNEIARMEYVRRLAEALRVSEEALLAELKKVRSDYAARDRADRAEIRLNEVTLPAAEKLAVGLMLCDMKACDLFTASLAIHDFRHHHLRRMVDFIFTACGKKQQVSPHMLIRACDDEQAAMIITDAILEAEAIEDKVKVAGDCIARIKKDSHKSRLHHIQELIKEAENVKDEQRVKDLIREYSMLVRSHLK